MTDAKLERKAKMAALASAKDEGEIAQIDKEKITAGRNPRGIPEIVFIVSAPAVQPVPHGTWLTVHLLCATGRC